jgi:hypothetical protein
VAFVGQVLTRRAIGTSEGMTMAEMTMRTWITVSLDFLSKPVRRRCMMDGREEKTLIRLL